MARTTNNIQAQITAYYVQAMAAIGITIDPTKWSRRNKQQLALNTFATGAGVLEQNFDALTADIESILASGAPDTAAWIQNLCLNVFQYDSTTPQIPQLDVSGGTYAPKYPVTDASKRIITACVVVPGIFGTTTVKALKGGSAPVSLTTGSTSELSSLQSFLNLIDIPGININATTGDPDKVYIQGLITYNGGYSAVIQATVTAAIQSFLLSIPTSGVAGVNSPVGLMKITDLITAVRAVPGVVDFEPVNINARLDTTAFTPAACNLISGTITGSGPYTVTANWINAQWNSGLSGNGTMITETTTGYTINDSLTYYAI